jgi:hypothetical protein
MKNKPKVKIKSKVLIKRIYYMRVKALQAWLFNDFKTAA